LLGENSFLQKNSGLDGVKRLKKETIKRVQEKPARKKRKCRGKEKRKDKALLEFTPGKPSSRAWGGRI